MLKGRWLWTSVSLGVLAGKKSIWSQESHMPKQPDPEVPIKFSDAILLGVYDLQESTFPGGCANSLMSPLLCK